MNVKLLTVLGKRRTLIDRYESLQRDLIAVREALAALPLVGHYPPNAHLYVCDDCNQGPFNAHEIRLHKPKCTEK